MSNPNPRGFNLVRALQKFIVSSFVICSFLAYAVHEHFTTSHSALDTAAPPPTEPVAQAVPDMSQPLSASSQVGQSSSTSAPAAQPAARPTATRPTARPTQAPTTTAKTNSGQYKDGTYTGPSVNAMYGLVRVQATIQNGQLKNVQALDYPQDRRTSQRINQQAIPWLQTEVIQAQSANVNIISGATLTSQAFIRSLQSALSGAKN
jgi:uncharacterized protein with FMN-binding domain